MIALLMAAAAALVPQPVLTIDPRHRIVEGVASDGRTIWVSSLLDRQILACRGKTCRTLATLPAGLHPFAINWDATRQRLWVAADCPPGVAGITPCARGALLGFDVSGKVRDRVAPVSGTFHPGDVTAAAGGVFVSDSQNGAIYRWAGRGKRLAAILQPGIGKSGQGTAPDASGKRLLVADYSQGIGMIDIATGRRTLLLRPDGKPLRGIDGLVRCGSTYYGLYNGASPGTLVKIDPTARGLNFGQPLGDVTLPDPTQIAVDGKRLLIVADSGWATLEKSPSSRSSGATIVAVALDVECRPK